MFTTLWRIDPDVACVWIRIAKEGTHLVRDLLIGGCYVPPASSAQTSRTSIQDRMHTLLQHAAQATSIGYVMLAGDFNARIASEDDMPNPPPPNIAPLHRGCSDTNVNPAGRLFLDICTANHLAVLTGRIADDCTAPCSFHGGNGSSRPDHVAIDYELYGNVLSHRVLSSSYGSDHHPISTTFSLSAPPPSARLPPHTTPLPPRVRWKRTAQADYFSSLSTDESQAAIATALSALSDELDSAVDSFVSILKDAAIAAGCRSSMARVGPALGQTEFHKPWFDVECRIARRALRDATASQPPNSPDLRTRQRHFRTMCKQKKQEHKRSTAMDFARLLRVDPNQLWRALQLRDCSASSATCPADPHTCTEYFSSVFDPPSSAPDDIHHALPPSIGSPADDDDLAMNSAITTLEVSDALKRLKNGKSPGIDGLPAELLKFAYPPRTSGAPPTSHLNPLVAPLTTIFNHLLQHSVVPRQWSATVVTLLFKKGDPMLWGNYRPIAVVQLLSKVYAMILHHRLSAWAEGEGIREPAQTGFRPHHATTHHAFVLQQHIAKYKAAGKKLYCCFIDFAKAYDSVPRHKLWQRLYDLGIRGRILHGIKSLYDVGVNFSIKLDAGLLDPIDVAVGVKQGCPLSPLLFGLYIEDLENYVKASWPTAGPAIRGVYMSLLMYADDTAVLANSPAELQNLLDCIQHWCTDHGMTIHVDKTEIVVFNTTADMLTRLGTRWSIAGEHVKVSQSFKYLGIHFHFSSGAKYGLQKAAQRGRFAVACLHRKLHDLDVGANIDLTLHLYSATVEPAMLYGCEVWGQYCLQLADPAGNNNLEVEQVHRNFLRHVLTVQRNTPVWIVYREAGMYPVQHACLRNMLAFLRRVLQLDDREYVKLAMLDCIAAATTSTSTKNWFSALTDLLHKVFWAEDIDSATIDVVTGRVEVDLCLTRWRDFYHRSVWHGLAPDPLTAPSHRVTLCTYHAWFSTDLPAHGEHWKAAPCITTPNVSYPHLISLIKLRTSNHKLAIQRLRPLVPRASRTCPLCGSGTVQDECHMLLHCPHLAQARLQYRSTFGQHLGMKAMFTNPACTPSLASFVHHHVISIDGGDN